MTGELSTEEMRRLVVELNRPTGQEDGPLGKIILADLGTMKMYAEVMMKWHERDWREGRITAYECARLQFNMRQEMRHNST